MTVKGNRLRNTVTHIYAYDPALGNLVGVDNKKMPADIDDQKSFTYDEMDRVTEETDSTSGNSNEVVKKYGLRKNIRKLKT